MSTFDLGAVLQAKRAKALNAAQSKATQLAKEAASLKREKGELLSKAEAEASLLRQQAIEAEALLNLGDYLDEQDLAELKQGAAQAKKLAGSKLGLAKSMAKRMEEKSTALSSQGEMIQMQVELAIPLPSKVVISVTEEEIEKELMGVEMLIHDQVNNIREGQQAKLAMVLSGHPEKLSQLPADEQELCKIYWEETNQIRAMEEGVRKERAAQSKVDKAKLEEQTSAEIKRIKMAGTIKLLYDFCRRSPLMHEVSHKPNGGMFSVKVDSKVHFFQGEQKVIDTCWLRLRELESGEVEVISEPIPPVKEEKKAKKVTPEAKKLFREVVMAKVEPDPITEEEAEPAQDVTLFREALVAATSKKEAKSLLDEAAKADIPTVALAILEGMVSSRWGK